MLRVFVSIDNNCRPSAVIRYTFTSENKRILKRYNRFNLQEGKE